MLYDMQVRCELLPLLPIGLMTQTAHSEPGHPQLNIREENALVSESWSAEPCNQAKHDIPFVGRLYFRRRSPLYHK